MTEAMGLQELRSAVADAGVCVPSVSKWSMGMHVHHCCLAMMGISRALIASTPPPPPSRRPFLASLLLLIGRIPRGRAEAPETATPSGAIPQADLLDLLDESARMLDHVAQLDPNTWFKHFAVGILDRDKAARFMHVHNGHQLRIISDIRKTGAR
jgi:hypothetical protein